MKTETLCVVQILSHEAESTAIVAYKCAVRSLYLFVFERGQSKQYPGDTIVIEKASERRHVGYTKLCSKRCGEGSIECLQPRGCQAVTGKA